MHETLFSMRVAMPLCLLVASCVTVANVGCGGGDPSGGADTTPTPTPTPAPTGVPMPCFPPDDAPLASSSSVSSAAPAFAGLTFASPAGLGTPPYASALAAADVTGDGLQDLVVAGPGLIVVPGVGGAFGAPIPLVAGEAGLFYAVAIGNLDSAGGFDLVVGRNAYFGTPGYTEIFVAMNVGTAAIAFPAALHAYSDPISPRTPSVALADLDGDGLDDILHLVQGYDPWVTYPESDPCHHAGVVEVFWNLGGGSFSLRSPLTLLVSHPDGMAVADVTGDGTADLVVGGYDHFNGHGVEILRGNPAGGFDAPQWIPTVTGNPGPPIIADVDGDLALDISFVTTPGGSKGGFGPAVGSLVSRFGPDFLTETVTSVPGASDVFVADDFDGDGDADFAFVGGPGIVFYVSSGGTVTAAGTLTMSDSSRPTMILGFQAGPDTKPDLAATQIGGLIGPAEWFQNTSP